MQARYGIRFSSEPEDHFFVVGKIVVENLHRCDLAEASVFHLVNDTHPTVTEGLDHAVPSVDDFSEPAVFLV